MHKFNSDGVEIAYLDESPGNNADAVLLIHGFASNVATNWVDTGWVKTLTGAGYRVIAYDNRGHGQSEKLYNLEDYGAPIMAEDARRLLDHLGIERAHVIGYSMGARIAAFLAIAASNPRTQPRVRRPRAQHGARRCRHRPGRASAGSGQHRRGDEFDGAHLPRFRRADEERPQGARRLHPLGPRADHAPRRSAALRCPVLVVVGEQDVIGGSAAELAALIPGARGIELAGRDHMKAVGDKGFKEAVLGFLAAQR